MKSTLGDLNNHLFAQLERLSDEEIKGDDLLEEIGRAKAVTSIATQIINNGNLVLQAQKFHTEFKSKDLEKPKMLEG
ncbi:hypothetical protein [Cytobacillus oceanisediminis]|uniref:hypothetical protein n=1 Tax=Cytobacillus oceanisediminis TaxID=665099 RepID=UPI00254AE69B|nr:hypothetical protein [Cytobacillus oceanisediminis]MDK7664377.1 hypothetical protein [Cytobacillus oceanisediminis]